MRALRAFALACAVVAAAASAGCAAGGGPEPQDVVTDIPWNAPETLRYQLKDGKEVVGTAQLAVERDGDALRITQSFRDDRDADTDDSEVVVDPDTLKPRSGSRRALDSEEDRLVVAESSYERHDDKDDVIRIKQTDFSPADSDDPERTRENPMRLKEHYYDNDTSLYLWRTIPFEKDYEVTYRSVIANRRRQVEVTLRVTKQKRVETPAGEFDSWEVEIKAGGDTQRAWFATTDDHRLLVYNNGKILFLYEGEG